MFQYCEMDTDSAYIALAGATIDDLVTSEHREHYFRNRSQWLPAECCDDHEEEYVCARIAGRSWTATESSCIARKAFDKRTPGLFKVEWRGNGFIGLCSKTYYCFGATDKYSTEGLSKRHNDIDKDEGCVQHPTAKTKARYCLRIQLKQEDISMWSTAFHDVAESILGVSVEDCEELNDDQRRTVVWPAIGM